MGYDVTVLDDPSIEAGSPPGTYIAAAEATEGRYVSLVLTPREPSEPDSGR